MRQKRQGSRYPLLLLSAGFSLIEIVVVMGLIGVVFTFAIVKAFDGNTEKKLRDATSDLNKMSRRARGLAMVQQRIYTVTLKQNKLTLAPLAMSEEEREKKEGKKSYNARFVEEEENVQASFPTVTDSSSWDKEVTLEILRWGKKEWETIEKKVEHILRYEPTGVCEPFSIRATMEDSYVQQEFNPLTGSVRDEESEIR